MQSDFEIIDNATAFVAGMPYELDLINESIYKRLDQMQIDFCKCLRLSGCRYIEMKDRQFIIAIHDTTVEMQAAKGGNRFFIDKNGLPQSFFDYYASGGEMYPTCRLQSFTRHLFNAFFPYRFFAGNRNLIKHLFRYRHIIALHRFGFTDQQISDTIGEQDNKNTKGYYEKEIIIEP